MEERRVFVFIVFVTGSLFAFSCKSYELRPEAQDVQVWIRAGTTVKSYDSFLKSLQENSQNPSSVFSKCRYLGVAPEAEFSPSRSLTNADLENDIKNQAAAKGGNIVFCNNSYGCYDGKMYQCDDLSAVIAAQNNIDARAAQADQLAKEKAEKELYTKPHYWTICAATGYSDMPPSVVQDMLKQFKQEAFDSENQCADKVWYLSKVGSQFGISCSCKYIKLQR